MKRKVKQTAAGALASVMVVSMMVFLFTDASTASATSLPHIESIIGEMKGGAEFNILEVVPEDGAGSIGYYVSGQEPSAQWKEAVGAIRLGEPDSNGVYSDAGSLRTSTMVELLDRLTNAQLLSNNDTTPLTSSGSYQETLPWARSSSGYGSLTLDHREKVMATGVFSQKGEEATNSVGYDYTRQSTYEIVKNGQYVQKIDKFILGTEATGGEDTYFYYAPTFMPLTETDAEEMVDKDIAVYTNAATDEDVTATPVYGQYRYYGRLEHGLEAGKVYYYVTETGTPTVAVNQTHVYKAKLDATDPYIDVGESGYFNLTITGYSYVGDGMGVYRFRETEDPGAVTLPISYNIVYYKGGYDNNNWFLTKVLDIDASEISGIKVNVTSATPNEVTEAKIENGDYQLIFLSNGYVPDGMPACYSAANDISESIKNTVLSAVEDKIPVVVDNALTATGLDATKIGSLAQSIKNDNVNSSYVHGNVYFVDTAAKNLATKDFDIAFNQSLYKTVDTPFYDVYYEIYHENFLRKTENSETTDLLDEWVSIAKSIRYIINFGQQRQISAKTQINVLDIEPLLYKPGTTNTVLKLTKDEVEKWLPQNIYTQDQITIITMTTAEFIGKIDDVSETYDMVYFGPSVYSSGDYSYNDTGMNGLAYTNIGDTYRAKNMSGLLARDYMDASYGTFPLDGENKQYLDATSETQANLFRFSGNDLTAAKVQKLRDFAATGYPVILSDYLLNNGAVNSAVVDSASQIYQLFDAIKSRGNVMSAESAENSKEAVYEYLNLSKPEILFAQNGFPTQYDESKADKGSLTPADGVYSLTYQFQIINSTDATPQETTYQLALYLDMDGNGNYVPSENLADILCYSVDSGGNAVSVDPMELKAGTSSSNAPTYKITRQLPPDMSGILPWKLEITKNGEGNEYIHTSQIDYTYIRPETPKELNILQIDTTADAGGYNLEYATTFGSGAYSGYNGIYGKLLHDVESDFRVHIYTIYTNDLDNLNSRSFSDWDNYFLARKNGSTKIDNYTTKVIDYLNAKSFFSSGYTSKNQALSDLLQQFDMLIVGFGDCYADFNANSAPAVVDYINSGKSILFSHDTTSFYNVPSGYQQMTVKPETSGVDVSAAWQKNTYYGTMSLSNAGINKATATFNSSYYSSRKKKYYRASGELYQNVHLQPGTYTLSATSTPQNIQGAQMLSCERASNSTYFQNGVASLNFTVSSEGDYWIAVEYNGGEQGSHYSETANYTFTLTRTTTKQTGSAPTGWGYYFNTILRSKVSLDRYGIVADDTVTDGSSSVVHIRNILKAATDGSVSSDIASKIEEAEYTVAYDAKSTDRSTVAETQGINNYELLRYATDSSLKGVYGLGSSNGGTFGTSKVSQVNKGQITTYPYNLNTTKFDSTNTAIGETLNVTSTHEQYYQLNMNSDDMVVWYCLSGGSYQNAPNDVVNSYYIYTVGNVTYTGAGHTSGASAINSNQGEAKLFINTMIAAYRPAHTAPLIAVVDSASSTNESANYYLTVDYDGSGYSNSLVEQSNTCPVYFIVTDANLDADRITNINLSYQAPDGGMIQYASALPVYRAPSSGRTYSTDVNGTNGMVSGMIYYFNLPQVILDTFAVERSISTMNIDVQVSTKFKDNKTLCGNTNLTLLKVGLLTLG